LQVLNRLLEVNVKKIKNIFKIIITNKISLKNQKRKSKREDNIIDKNHINKQRKYYK